MTQTETYSTGYPTADPRYGEREIEIGLLTTFPNPRPGREHKINITLPEFTCKCPFSGYPDFATTSNTGRQTRTKISLAYRTNWMRQNYLCQNTLFETSTFCQPHRPTQTVQPKYPQIHHL